MGIDERDVETHQEAKSIGHEETFSEDIVKIELAKMELLHLANKVARRLRRHGVTGRTVILKVKYSNFQQITRSTKLPESTDDGPEIYSTVCRLMEKTALGQRPVRLLGISLSHLTFLGKEEQLTLFDRSKDTKKSDELNRALDTLYEKHGDRGVRPGTLLEK